MSDDPINPAHYAGRACADIGERLTANGYQILKYCWRLGLKDDPLVELGKAEWYAGSECRLLAKIAAYGVTVHTAPLVLDLPEPQTFLRDRISSQPLFTRTIAQLLWRGYNHDEMQVILRLITDRRAHYAGS